MAWWFFLTKCQIPFLRKKCADSRKSVESQWEKQSAGNVPKKAFIGGRQSQENIFIVRVKCSGKFIPGQLRPSQKEAIIAYRSSAIRTPNYQVFCDKNVKWKWINLKSDKIPEKAITVGKRKRNDKKNIYIGRVNISHNAVLIGRIDAERELLYVPYREKEVEYKRCEILLQK